MINEMTHNEAPFIGVNRHRIGVDGEGVTTLAAFHGCPLRCRYCLNPSCLDADARVRKFTPETLYQELLIDDLYFVATGGGVCFGGGEPLLRPEFIRQFHTLCAGRWKITLETSLNVPLKSLQTVAPLVNDFIIRHQRCQRRDLQGIHGKIERSSMGEPGVARRELRPRARLPPRAADPGIQQRDRQRAECGTALKVRVREFRPVYVQS